MRNVVEQLQQTDLFREVEIRVLEELVQHMKEQRFPAGTVLFHANDAGDTMYIIQEGRIRIFMYDQQGHEITLTHYGKNEIFGELAPIDNKPRSASASAAEDLTVMALNREDFLAFLYERPQIGLAMMRSLSQRLRNTTTYLEEFQPQAFESEAVDKGEALRKGASDLVASIIDGMNEEDEVASEEQKPQRGNMGIFDRVSVDDEEE